MSDHGVLCLQRKPDPTCSAVEQRYSSRMDALAPHERISRCTAMLKWTRDLLARQILAELGEMPDEQVKWEVAKRMYGTDPAAMALSERRLKDVSC